MIPHKIRVAVALVLALVFAGGPPAEAAKKTSKKPAATRKAPAKKKARKPAAPAVPVASGRTLEERLASLMGSSIARSSNASLQVVEVETGRVVGELNPHHPVAPASNMKLFTTAAAMDLLGSGFEFRTTVSMRGTIDAQGTLHGDVKVTGRGDPAIGGRFHDGAAASVPKQWASELKKAGVRTIDGNLLFEYGYFDDQFVHPTWPRDQLVNWYEAPVAALSMQEGCVMVRVLPGRPRARATVQFEPPNTLMKLTNSCVTGGGRGVFVTRRLGTNQIIVDGNVPPRSGATEIFVTVESPIHYFANVTHLAFENSGVHVGGSVLLVEREQSPDWKPVAEHRTPLDVVIYVINKKSQNHYAEQLLKTIGAEKRRDGSFAGGSAAIRDWLVTRVGVSGQELSQIDGSGMSRFNRASAAAFIGVLRYMWKTPNGLEFLSSMPYSGEADSRLRRRLHEPQFARKVYAKTGYISGVIGLSGYVHADSGRVYAFSFLFNNYRTGVWGVYRLQDQMLKEIVKGG